MIFEEGALIIALVILEPVFMDIEPWEHRSSTDGTKIDDKVDEGV